MILKYLKQNKINVDAAVVELLNDSKAITSIHLIGIQTIEKTVDFSISGKGIRGVLTLLGYEMYGKKIDKDALKVAAAMEIIHSSLLIHDDIIDNDKLRRGKETIFYQYQKIGEEAGIVEAKQYGLSMGICAGDLGLYLPINAISKLNINAEIKCSLIELLTSEISKTAVAEMLDAHFGLGIQEPTVEEIGTVYLYKTGRYTFSLPLMLGAILAGKKVEELLGLEKLGETLGVVFQLVDDWLGLHSSESDLGKPVGSDIRENKRTLIRSILFSKADNTDKKYLESVFGNSKITDFDIKKVQEIIKKNHVKEQIDAIIEKLSAEALTVINNLLIEDYYKNILSSLVEYNKTRLK